MRELGVSIISDGHSDVEATEHIRMIKDAGFDCFFGSYQAGKPVEAWANLAERIGLRFETIHAPFDRMNDMWTAGESGELVLSNLKTCIDMCSQISVGICIMHVTIGTTAPKISDTGLDRFRTLNEYAHGKSVRIAFENLEIPQHLEAVLKETPAYHGFCWDCGHNYCYTPLVDMMPRYGDRLICTHIHDSYGVRTPGHVTFDDDLHLIPFDGGLNWHGFAERIKNSGYKGPLTLELSSKGRQEYQTIRLEEHYSRAYSAAARLRFLCDGE